MREYRQCKSEADYSLWVDDDIAAYRSLASAPQQCYENAINAAADMNLAETQGTSTSSKGVVYLNVCVQYFAAGGSSFCKIYLGT